MSVKVIQISSAHGPIECEFAVQLTLDRLMKENKNLKCKIIKEAKSDFGYKSITLQLDGDEKSMDNFCNEWLGSIQWIFQSHLRETKRKNWFVGIDSIKENSPIVHSKDILYTTCKASGKGGQHINKNETAVRALHLATGIQVKVQAERSQFQNKKNAEKILLEKLQKIDQSKHSEGMKENNHLHWKVEKGNSVKTFHYKKQ